MKKIIYCALALALGVSAGYSVGKDSYRSIKDYQSACMLGDICKFAIENGNFEFEELYEDYLGNLECDPKVIVTREEIESYSWIYNNK